MNLAKLHTYIAKIRPDVISMSLEDGIPKWDESLPNQEEIQALVDNYVEQPDPVISVTNQQLRQALILKSFNENKPELHPEAIRVFLNTLTEPTKSIALNFWEYSNMMDRKNAILNQLSPMLGLSSQDIDNLFIVAGGL